MSARAPSRFSVAFPPPIQQAQKLRYQGASSDDEDSKIFFINRPPTPQGEREIEALIDEGYYLFGICAYENWPGRVHNPGDGDPIRTYDLFSKNYYQRFAGFLHNFRAPGDVFPDAIPLLAMDFSDYVQVRKRGREKVYDLIYYAGHKIDGKPATVEWSRVIKQHDLALALIRELLATEPDIRICLVHDSFGIDDPRVERFDFLGYREFLDKVEASRVLLVPNLLDASPRIITEALCLDTYVMVNAQISGGWKYVNPVTGAFFEAHDGAEVYRKLRARGPAGTRAWFLRHYPNHVLEDRFNAWLHDRILSYCAFNRFGRVLYLSPDGAVARHRAITRELFRHMGIYGDCVERVSMVEIPDQPDKARALSHLAALRRARELGLPDVVIFEDDFQFIVPRQVANRKLGAIVEGFLDWDAIVLGNSQIIAHESSHDAAFHRVAGASIPHGYAIRARLYDALIAGLSAACEAGDDICARLREVWAGVAKAGSVVAFRDPIGEGLPRRGGPGGAPEPPDDAMVRVGASCAD
jgi:hypothetical protein